MGAMPYIWTGFIVLAVIVESLTMQLVAIWFMPAAVASLILSFFVPQVWIQFAVFVVLSALMIILSRKIFKKTILKKPFIPTNVNALIGKTGIVTANIDNIEYKGEVKIEGKYWSARSFDGKEINADSLVEIISIEGVKLIVKKITD